MDTTITLADSEMCPAFDAFTSQIVRFISKSTRSKSYSRAVGTSTIELRTGTIWRPAGTIAILQSTQNTPLIVAKISVASSCSGHLRELCEIDRFTHSTPTSSCV